MTQLAAFRILIAVSTWILTFAMHGLFTHGAALLAGRTIVRSPRHRGMLWKAALLLPFATATIATTGLRPAAVIADIDLPELGGPVQPGGQRNVYVEQRTVHRNGAPVEQRRFSTDSRALLLGAGVGLLTLIGAVVALTRLRRRHRDFQRRLGTRTRIVACDGEPTAAYQLTCSSNLGAPVALGRREVCVPALTFYSLSPNERRSVLAHEVAHLTRRDPFWFAMADLIVAAMPWQPLVRIVVREMRRDAEFCCDDAVVDGIGDGRALVRSLATFAAAFDPAETALAASCGGSPLEERARRILAPVSAVSRWSRIGLVAGLLVMATGAFALAPVVSTRTAAIGPIPPGSWTIKRMILVDSEAVVR